MLNAMQNDVHTEEQDLLSYWQMIVEAWRTTPDEFNEIIQYFNNTMHTNFFTYAPLQIIGDFWGNSEKILVVTEKPKIELTPEYKRFETLERGFEASNEKREGFTWVNQLLFALNYFKLLRKNNVTVEYYSKLNKLVHYYDDKLKKTNLQYDALQKRVIQIHLIPFYTNLVTIDEVNPTVKGSFKRIANYFFNNNFETIFINKILLKTILESDFVVNNEYVKIDQNKGNQGLSLIEFTLERNDIKKKGLAVQDIDSLSNEELQIVAKKLRELSDWNKNIYL